MGNKIVLIDGHSILNRAFYGLPDLTNAEGLHTNAIYGFLNIMFKIIEEEQPDYLTVAFDVHAPTFRHDMFRDYKGTRKPMADELRQQVPVMKEVLKSMGIKLIEQAGLEADDLLGTISKRAHDRGMQVSIISGDRDLLQLATDQVKVRIPKTKMGRTEVEDYYAEDVLKKYQVTPTEFIDLKALMGDSSDNIPGVPSIGEKTATKIITEYHSIENAYEHVDELKPPRASKALKEHWDMAVMSKTLATIEVNADFDYDFEEAKLGNIYTESAYAYFQRLQFKNMLGRFDVVAPAHSVEEKFKVITKQKEAEAIMKKASEQETVGIVLFKDMENVLPLFADQALIGGVALCYSKDDIYLLSCKEEINAEWVLGEISRLSTDVKNFVIFNLKENLDDLSITERAHCFDTLIAAYLLNPLNSNYTYADVARENLDLIVEEKLEDYKIHCYEAYILYCSYPVLLEKLRKANMEKLFREIEMPLVFTLYEMEQNGVRVEAEELKKYGEALSDKIVELEKGIYEEAGEVFNINSPKQLGIILFDKLGIPGGRKTKTGYSTAADVLEKLAPEQPVIAKILEYRTLSKLKSTYVEGLANYICDDGRIHGKFNQTITATGRISSTEPNLQNIPIRMELGRMIRKVFVPEEGYEFVDADYSQIELRVLASCSGDEKLIQAYKDHADIHRITASQVFHVPFDKVTSLQRRNAKAVNFGIVYGISSFGLSQDLSISRKEAAKYIEDYFETYPGIKEFLDRTVEDAKEKGYVSTLFGRRRPVPELSSSNFMQRSFGERVAMNSPIQGTAADIMKIAMIGVEERLKKEKMKSRLVLQVHDELLIEAWKPETEKVKVILEEEMEHAAEFAVPLEIDMHIGNTWYETK